MRRFQSSSSRAAPRPRRRSRTSRPTSWSVSSTPPTGASRSAAVSSAAVELAVAAMRTNARRKPSPARPTARTKRSPLPTVEPPIVDRLLREHAAGHGHFAVHRASSEPADSGGRYSIAPLSSASRDLGAGSPACARGRGRSSRAGRACLSAELLCLLARSLDRIGEAPRIEAGVAGRKTPSAAASDDAASGGARHSARRRAPASRAAGRAA